MNISTNFPYPQNRDDDVQQLSKWAKNHALELTRILNNIAKYLQGSGHVPASSTATGLTLDATTQVLSFTALYSLPLTTDTAKGVTAYGWGDHASEGYAVLAGKSGGQTLVGGTITTETLNLYANAANDGSGWVNLGYAGGIVNIAGTANFTGSAALPVNIGTVALVDVTAGTYQGLNFSDNILHSTNGLYVRTSSVKLFGSTTGKDVTIQALATTAADYTLTLPPDGGTADFLVKTNGSGVLGYVDPATLSVSYAATAGNADTADFADDATHADSADTAGNWSGHPYPAGAVGVLYNDGADNLSWVSALTSTLADGKIFVGNSSNVATAVTPTGDVTISNAGVTAIGATKITAAMVNSAATNIINPTGSIIMYGGSSAPSGWVLCDGTSYARTGGTYDALFAVIGTTFGAVDGSHFSVPDMRGVYAKGAGTTDRAAGKDANGNYYAETLGTYVTDKMQGHLHSFLKSASAPGGGGSWVVGGGTTDYTQTPTTDGTNGTPRTGLTTEPQHLGLTYIIKL